MDGFENKFSSSDGAAGTSGMSSSSGIQSIKDYRERRTEGWRNTDREEEQNEEKKASDIASSTAGVSTPGLAPAAAATKSATNLTEFDLKYAKFDSHDMNIAYLRSNLVKFSADLTQTQNITCACKILKQKNQISQRYTKVGKVPTKFAKIKTTLLIFHSLFFT